MRKIILTALCFLLPQLTQASEIDNVRILTEEYPPYNYMDSSGALVGISVEVLDEVLKELGSKKSAQQSDLMPWARAYKLAQSQSYSMLFSTTRTPAREYLFKWSPPIIETKISLIARKQSNIKIETLDDLKGMKIGVVRDDIGHLLLTENNVDPESIQPTASADWNLSKLRQGRIDLFAYDENVAFWLLKNMHQNADQYEVVHVLQSGHLAFAFNPSISQSVVNTFNEALEKVKNSPAYIEILSKYRN